MSSKKWSGASFDQRLTDVLKGIDSIRCFTQAMDLRRFVADEKTQSAVEFQLLIISEACAKILDMRADVAKKFPDVPWTRVRALANVLRHDMDGLTRRSFGIRYDRTILKGLLRQCGPYATTGRSASTAPSRYRRGADSGQIPTARCSLFTMTCTRSTSPASPTPSGPIA